MKMLENADSCNRSGSKPFGRRKYESQKLSNMKQVGR